MTKEALQEILHVLELDYETEPSLVYVFYTTPDGRVNNFSISVRKGGTMSRKKLEALMQREYPATRESKILAVDRPEPAKNVEWLDVNDVCRMLHITDRTLRRWTGRGLFHPSAMEGCRKLYYRRDEIDRVLQSKAVQENGRIDKTALD